MPLTASEPQSEPRPQRPSHPPGLGPWASGPAACALADVLVIVAQPCQDADGELPPTTSPGGGGEDTADAQNPAVSPVTRLWPGLEIMSPLDSSPVCLFTAHTPRRRGTRHARSHARTHLQSNRNKEKKDS